MRSIAIFGLAAALLSACGSGAKPQACAAGAACPASSPCRSGAIACDPGGAPSCVEMPVADGTACGADLACLAGSCEPPLRTVQVDFRTVYWKPDGTQVVRAEVPADRTFSIYVEKAGGYDVFPAAPAGATLAVPGIPRVPWFLAERSGSGYVWLTQYKGTRIVREANVAGRPDQRRPTTATLVQVSFTGLDPWSVGNSLIEISSASVSLWAPPWGALYGGPDLAQDATTAAGGLDWLTQHTGSGPPPLLDAAQGDEAWVHQLSPRRASGGPLDGVYYIAASRAARLTGSTLADGVGGSLAGALAPAPAQASLALAIDGSVPAAHEAALGPSAGRSLDLQVFVEAAPFGNGPVAPSGPYLDLASLFAPAPAPGQTSIGFGRFLGAPWEEAVTFYWGRTVSLRHPGATSSLSFQSAMFRRVPAPAAGSVSAEIALSPVRDPRIDGADAFSPQVGVGAEPTLTWSPPALGSATSYLLLFYRLRATASGGTSYSQVWRARVFEPRFRVPPSLLAAGETYTAVVRAHSAPWDGIDRANTGGGMPFSAAMFVSAPFTIAAAP